MATVPDRFIKDKQVDYEGEILAFFDCGSLTRNKRIKPFSMGVMSLLEMLDNNLFKGQDPTWFDYASIFYVNDKREKCVELVSDYARGYKKPLENKVRNYMFFKRISIRSFLKLKESIDIAFAGFNMMPRGGDTGIYFYGAETLSNIAYVCADKLNISYKEVWWETPMSLVGHIMAVHGRINGMKGIGRRKDEDHLKFIFKKCKQWDKEEKLYPWQILEPEFYGLELYQDSKKIKEDYKKRLNEVKQCQN